MWDDVKCWTSSENLARLQSYWDLLYLICDHKLILPFVFSTTWATGYTSLNQPFPSLVHCINSSWILFNKLWNVTRQYTIFVILMIIHETINNHETGTLQIILHLPTWFIRVCVWLLNTCLNINAQIWTIIITSFL